MEMMTATETQLETPVLKPEGLAGLMEVSTRTLRRWELKGLLPRPFLVGSQKYWVREEINEWIACRCPNRTLWERMRPKYRRKSS
jgi:predicted DNA-binding transcriptional regulator AlpA